MFFCTRTSILMVIVTLTLVSVSTVSAKRKKRGTCDENRPCKYGGVCHNNQCQCNFDCNLQSWQTKIYCKPRKPGRRREYYFNMCYLLAHACEKQEDIPIIRMNLKTGICEDESSPTERLCPNAEDFMGPCGGSIASGSLDGGICLQDVPSAQTRCVCPAGRTGEDCQSKLYQVRSIHDPSSEFEHASTNFVAAGVSIAVFSFVCCFTVIGASVCIIRRYKLRHRNGACNSSALRHFSFSAEDDIVQRKHEDDLYSTRSIKSMKDTNKCPEERPEEFPSSANLTAVVVIPSLTSAQSQSVDKKMTTDLPASSLTEKADADCLKTEQNNNNYEDV